MLSHARAINSSASLSFGLVSLCKSLRYSCASCRYSATNIMAALPVIHADARKVLREMKSPAWGLAGLAFGRCRGTGERGAPKKPLVWFLRNQPAFVLGMGH